MNREVISTTAAPAAIGAYSQAVKVGEWIFVSGQIPLDPQTGELVSGEIQSQVRRVLENAKAILLAADSSLADVVKATIFLRDMNDFQAVNAVWAEYFPVNPPARAAVQVARLPRDVGVEVELIALACRT